MEKSKLEISPGIKVPKSEIAFSAMRAPGPGGQNVNKVATAVLLRFNIKQTISLSEEERMRLLSRLASQLTVKGEILIKANRFRSLERNKQDALQRLQQIIKNALIIPKKRKQTKPKLAAREQRLTTKKRISRIKLLRHKKHLTQE